MAKKSIKTTATLYSIAEEEGGSDNIEGEGGVKTRKGY